MKGIKFLIIALCIFKVIDAAPAAQSSTSTTTTTSKVPQSNNPDLSFPISGNGTCGQAVGTRCPDGFCCSSTGACGDTPGKCPFFKKIFRMN
jgi:glutamate synthase domain-containing protein 3